MISIARKNLSCLFLNSNSFLRRSNVHFLPSTHFFSTSSITPSPEIYDVLFHKHHFSPKFTYSLASLHLPKLVSPKSADLLLSFLKEYYSFTTSQLEKIVRYDPRILGFTIEGLQFRLKLFRDLGLSSEDIAKMIVPNTTILHSSVEKRIIPSLSILKGLLGSNDEVARLLRKSVWFVSYDLGKSLMPNVEILKSRGIPVECVLHFLYSCPRCFLIKPDIMRKSVDKAIEFGVPLTSVVFIHVVVVIAHTSQTMWEVKLQSLCNLGFSKDDIFTMFRKHPQAFSASANRLKNAVELLVGIGKYNISSIVTCPASLMYNIEKRLEPRLQILRLLESRNLIGKWSCLSKVSSYTDARVLDQYVSPYTEEVGEEFYSIS